MEHSLCLFLCAVERLSEATVGYYRVRAVDYWSRTSAFTPVQHYPAT